MRRGLITGLAVACALSVAASPVAVAASASGSGAQAIADCYSHQQLTAQYTASALRNALATMPADVREYSDCYDIIEKQLLAQLGTSKGGSAPATASSSGSLLPTPLLVIIILLAITALGFGLMALRRRNAPEGPDVPGSGGGSGPNDPAGQAPARGPDPPTDRPT